MASEGDGGWLVVGLGNPGSEYETTAHNLGFHLVEELARRWNVRLRTLECQAVTGLATRPDMTVRLAQPQTFMNLSGAAVRQLTAKYPAARLLVAADELDLPWGQLRLKPRGSAGTHNGLRSIVDAVGTEFARLRMGIQPPHPVEDAARYVLMPLGKAQRQVAAAMVAEAADAVEMTVREGLERAMNRYNARPETEQAKDL